MGEQTLAEAKTEIQSPSQPQPPVPPSQPVNPKSPTDSPALPPPIPVPDSTTDLSQIPSKIPIRPQKIRKLSSTTSTTTSTSVASPQEKPTDEDFNKSIVVSSATTSTTTVTAATTTSTTTTTTTATKTRRRNPAQSAKDIPKVIRPLSAPGEVGLALQHLRTADPLLANLIDAHPPPSFDSNHAPFLALTKSILYQQLAYKAGTSIYTRFVTLCGGEEAVRPDTVLALSTQQLKQIGVSGRKASYLYDLANKYKNGILSDESVVKMDDRSLFTMLSMVKGIGSWSVHMFMIFSLHRPDVLPVSDLGVRKGVQLLYALEELPRPSQMEQLCEKWRPYRSVGAWYMWRFVEGKGAPIAGATSTALESSFAPQQQQLDQSEQQQQQHQLQMLESINSMGNLGSSDGTPAGIILNRTSSRSYETWPAYGDNDNRQLEDQLCSHSRFSYHAQVSSKEVDTPKFLKNLAKKNNFWSFIEVIVGRGIQCKLFRE